MSHVNDNPSYRLGQLVAILVKHKAIRQEQMERVPISAATIIPAAIGHLTRSGKGEAIAAIMAELPAEQLGPPADEGQFWIGYYHQRAAIKGPRAEEPEPLDDRFEFRLSADLKGWMLEQGGGEYLRQLLREAKERG